MKLTFGQGPRAGEEVSILPGQSITIGRDESAGLVINDSRVSRAHARISVPERGPAVVEDLGSSNGTFVNGVRIAAPTVLHDRDTLAVADARFTVGDVLAPDARQMGLPPAQTQDAGPSRSRSGLTVLRTSVAKADRRARIAMTVAVGTVAIAIVAAGFWYLTPRPLSNDQVVALLKPSVVLVNSAGQLFDSKGTGWVLDAGQGLIVTNNHVIAGATPSVTFAGGPARPATVVGSDPCDDVAVLKVADTTGLVSAVLGSQGALHQGDAVLAIGYPTTASTANFTSQDPLVVTNGVISIVATEASFPGSIVYPNALQTTAKVDPGNSGGPLVTQDGHVVGMDSFSDSKNDENYAIGIDRIKTLLVDLAAGHAKGWTAIGFSDESVEDLAKSNIIVPNVAGLIVEGVAPGTPAASSGAIPVPSVITAIDGTPMDGSLSTFCKVVANKVSGESGAFSFAYTDSSGTVQTKDVTVPFQ